MPNGKPANTRCIHLTEEYLCDIFHHPERPQVCADFSAAPDICGTSRSEALILLERLEIETSL
ncbi:MAG: Fe-S-cluster domain [Idiomarinaceae bacterium HL-53]|nr:MAG: Fe-S-cluster domain [Idiomarinaceae bacterium HL-53]